MICVHSNVKSYQDSESEKSEWNMDAIMRAIDNIKIMLSGFELTRKGFRKNIA